MAVILEGREGERTHQLWTARVYNPRAAYLGASPAETIEIPLSRRGLKVTTLEGFAPPPLKEYQAKAEGD